VSGEGVVSESAKTEARTLRAFLGIQHEPDIAVRLARIARGSKHSRVKPVTTSDMHHNARTARHEVSMEKAIKTLRRATAPLFASVPLSQVCDKPKSNYWLPRHEPNGLIEDRGSFLRRFR
jgi:hypothetical protein